MAQPSDLTILDYLRHGRPDGGSRYRGHGVDDPLSGHGWQQMRDTTAFDGGWQQVVSSPMQRCLAFAEWFACERGLPLAVEHDLREVGFGAWEGVGRDELRTQRRDEYEAFYRDPVNNRPAGAEPLDTFAARVGEVFDRLAAGYRGSRVLVVAHAGVIRATLGHVTRSPAIHWYRAEVDNAGLTRFAADADGPRLIAHNWRPAL